MAISLDDVLGAPAATAEEPAAGEFSKGLTRGGLTLRSQLNTLAGSLGENVGLDQFARGRYQSAADDLRGAEAQEYAPRVASYKDVHSLRDAGDYAAATLGGMVPAAALTTGAAATAALSRGRINPFVAGFVPTAAINTGDVLQREAADPVASQRGAGTNLRNAAIAGGLSALGETLVPTALGQSLVGRGLGSAARGAVGDAITEGTSGLAKRGLARGVLGGAVHGALTEGGAGGVGELIRQQGVEPGRAPDWDAAAENAIGGAIGGGAMGGASHVADAAHAAPRAALAAPGRIVDTAREYGGMLTKSAQEGADAAKPYAQSALDTGAEWGKKIAELSGDAGASLGKSISERTSAARDWGQELLAADDVPAEVKAQAQAAMQNVGNNANQAWLKAASQARDFFAKNAEPEAPQTARDIEGALAPDDTTDRLASGTPLGDLSSYASRKGRALHDYVEENAGRAAEWTKNKAQELYQRADLSPDTRARVDSALADSGSAANQAWVATQAKAAAARDKFAGGVAKLAQRLQPKDDGAKKSLLGTSARQDIVRTIMEGLPEDLHGNTEAINSLGDSSRHFIDAVKSGDMDKMESSARGFHDVLGDKAEDTLARVYQIVGENDPKATDRFYKVLNGMREDSASRGNLQALIASSLPEGTRADVPALVEHLSAWAQGRDGAKNMGPAMAQFYHNGVRSTVEKAFGPNAEKIYKALERHAQESGVRTAMESPEFGAERAQLDAGEGKDRSLEFRLNDAGLAETTGDQAVFGGGHSGQDLMRDPIAYEAQWGKKDSPAHKLIEKLQAQYPAAAVRFEADPSDPHGRGRVVVEREADETQLNDKDFAAAKADSRYPDSPSRIKTPGGKGHTYDAMRIVTQTLKRMPSDGRPSRVRAAQAFMDGIAQLADRYGAQITDDSVKPADRAERSIHLPDSLQITKDMTYGQAKKLDVRSPIDKSSDKKTLELVALRKEYVGASESRRAAIVERARALTERAEEKKAMEMSRDEVGGDSAQSAYEEQQGARDDLKRLYGRGGFKSANDPTLVQARRLMATEWGEDNNRKDAAFKQFFGENRNTGRYAMQVAAAEGKLERLQNQFLVRAETELHGQMEIGKDDQIHTAAALGEEDLIQRSNMDGSAHDAPRAKLTDGQATTARSALLAAERLQKSDSNIARNVGKKLQALADNAHAMGTKDIAKLDAAIRPSEGQRTVSSVAETVNTLYSKYRTILGKADAAAKEPAVGKTRADIEKVATENERPEGGAKALDGAELDKRVRKEDFSGMDLKSFDKTMGLLSQMRERWQQLEQANRKGTLSGDDYDALLSYRDKLDQSQSNMNDLGSFFDEVPKSDPKLKAAMAESNGDLDTWVRKNLAEGPQDPKAQAAQKAALDQAASSSDPALLKELRTTGDARGLQRTAAYLADKHPDSTAARVAGGHYDQLARDPDTAYSLLRTSQSAQTAGTQRVDAATRAGVEQHIRKVLGDSVSGQWKKLLHAGEFDRTKTGDVIRLSVYALDPQSTAFHESMHAFVAQMRDMGAHDAYAVLDKAASSAAVRNQLRELLKDEPDALRQLSDREERIAYMYQAWADGRLKLDAKPTTVLGKVAEFIRNVLGIWSNDQRALHILEHFNSGEYAKNIGDRNALYRATMDEGRNRAIETLKAAAQPLNRLGQAVFAAGDARLRDTQNGALVDIADAIKPRNTQEATDPGFIAASRSERTTRMNRLAAALDGYDGKQMAEALKALQQGTKAASTEARVIQAAVKKTLRDAYNYMHETGVEMGDLGADYFPRVWDSHYISTHQAEFRAMLEKHAAAGQFDGDPDAVMRTLLANDGNSFSVDTRQPGMQHGKERVLSFIEGADAEPFLNKDLFQTMNSYLAQATRRAEWARRFGAGGEKLSELFEQARKEGATNDQIAAAENYLRGVTGTLGDGINPTARRLIGNAIVYQNVRLLPLAIFSSVVDPMGIIVRGGEVGDAWHAFKRGVAEIPKNFRKYNPGAKDGMTSLAETLGVIDNAALLHSVGALYSQGMVGDTGRRVNDLFFRFNLMEQFNTSMRVGATEAALKFLERHADGTASPHSARWLAELGLQPGDVKMANDRVALTEADGLSAGHALRMREAVNRWVDGAVLRPDAADKPIWMNDPHWALVAHLKQFTYSFQRTIINRVMHEVSNGNYSPAYALLSYVPIMIAADMAKGLIQGGGEEPDWKKDWGAGDYLWSGVQRAGLLGVGQIGADVLGDIQRGNSGLGALAGPTLEQLGDAVDVVGGHERFNDFTLHSMPANALYSSAFHGGGRPDPTFAE